MCGTAVVRHQNLAPRIKHEQLPEGGFSGQGEDAVIMERRLSVAAASNDA
jgi:hypothetical protein